MLSKDEKQRLYRLYERYNFNKEEECSAAVVFTYCDGYFYNAEIVCFENRDEEEVQKLRKSYESGGYSVRELCYESLEKTHELLFKGFFNVDGSRRRLQNEYEKFFELQSEKLFQAEYEYIEPNYIVGKEVKTENLISTILDQLTSDGPQLVIVEAAAGFGKTCTSYEIVKNMLESENVETPIFMELSKNRRAALFRYVLLDEIDKKFNNLSSPLVLYEIENGKVPLIIDGFDELLSRSNKSTDAVKAEHDEDAQTMLDTIAELFNEHGNAKVVLTSRKSSILTGEGFKEWAEKQLKNCKVTRISIEDPTVKDWLGADKYEFLIRKEIPLESITNPILLSFLRSMPLEDFEEKCSDAENVLNYYFESLLDREKGRQSLVLTVGEQLDIMVKLASNMVQYDIHSEETAFIRSILMDIIHEQFPEYRNRYLQVEERPTEETFVYKLADHALLNRVSTTKNEIGFINDFVFGYFIAEAIMSDELPLGDIGCDFVDIASTAVSVRDDVYRYQFHQKIQEILLQLNYEQQLDVELKLLSTINRNYQHHYISNRSFGADVYFDGNYKFLSCTFYNCNFNRSIIYTSAFEECVFSDCRFYNVEIEKDTWVNCNLIFYDNCFGHSEFAELAAQVITENKSEKDYEIEILKRFWKGRFSKGRQMEVVLLKAGSTDEQYNLRKALDSLKKKGYVEKDAHYWKINKTYLKEISDILGKTKDE